MKFSILYLLVLVAILLQSSCTSRERNEIEKPNILFISIDDLRPALGVYGDTTAITPNIDTFASEGAVFKNTYTQVAVCAPSRASLMTGIRPDSLRVWHLGDKFRKINPNAVTIPQHFSKNGYYTVNLGKIFHNYMPDSISWDEPDLRPVRYLKKDWLKRDGETFYISESVNNSQKIKRDSLLKLRPIRYADGWNTGPAWEAADVHDSMYYDGAQNELTKKVLTRISKQSQPFFMGLGYFRPHLPFAVPKKYWDFYNPQHIPLANNNKIPENSPKQALNSMYELRHYDGFHHIQHPTKENRIALDTARILKHGYYASVSYVDKLLGDLFIHMKKIGIYDNTIIILWGDHGWKLGDHNSWGKMTNYNIDLKVPMIIKYPNQKIRGIQLEQITELIDIFPSLCDLSNIEKPAYFQGTSFASLLDNPNLPWKNSAFSQFHRRPKVSADGKRYMGYSINTKNYHYIEWYHWNAKKGLKGKFQNAELYDSKQDPYETKNLINNENLKDTIVFLAKELSAGWRNALPKMKQ